MSFMENPMQRFEGVIAMLPTATRRYPNKRFRSPKSGEALVAMQGAPTIAAYRALSLAALHQVRIQTSKPCRVELWDSVIKSSVWSCHAPEGASVIMLAENSVMLIAQREHNKAFYYWKLRDMRGRGNVVVESAAFFYIKPLEVAK